jgi:GNAT superfamily N-acetyltransferase
MSATAPIEPIEPEPAPGAGSTDGSWRVRAAHEEDLMEVVGGVRELLMELGANPPDPAAMQAATRALLRDGEAGAILVAEAEGTLVGLLACSWQTAIHAAGRYALIQDLWVHPCWRSRSIGRDLLAAAFELARAREIACVEVGLPRGRFAGVRATEAFYAANDFTLLGARMRRALG